MAEALGGLCVHIATEDLKQEPQSYPECFRLMQQEGITQWTKDLVAITRLRNLLTHRCWTIDDKQVYDSIKNNFKRQRIPEKREATL